jgi:phospholipid/cholesterol/gamma-HCH transport system substrate-binding protein
LALTLAGIGAAVALLANLLGGGGDPYVVYARFTDAGGILKNYNVKVGGVPAGEIKDITLDGQDHAVVRMELRKGAYPIGADASAKVRPVNLLGEKYVDLDAGDLDRPQPSGTTIPVSRTGVPTELDDVLNMLDPMTRGGLRILVNEAGVALAGRGVNFSKTLEQLPPALDQASALVDGVAKENRTLGQLIDEGDRVIASVNGRRDDLGKLVESASATLRTTAERRQQLGQTVRNAPAALGQLRNTLADLQRTSRALAPTARDLRATSPALADVLERAPAFARDADGALRAARDVAPQLAQLGRRGTPPLRHLAPTAQRLADFAGDLQPLTEGLDGKGALKAVLSFIDGWAGVIGGRDGLGNVFRVHVTLSDQLLTSVMQRMSADALDTAKRALRPKPVVLPGVVKRVATPPAPAKPVDKVTSIVPKVLDTVPKVLDTLLQGKRTAPRNDAAPSGDVTRLLSYLLG